MPVCTELLTQIALKCVLMGITLNTNSAAVLCYGDGITKDYERVDIQAQLSAILFSKLQACRNEYPSRIRDSFC